MYVGCAFSHLIICVDSCFHLLSPSLVLDSWLISRSHRRLCIIAIFLLNLYYIPCYSSFSFEACILLLVVQILLFCHYSHNIWPYCAVLWCSMVIDAVCMVFFIPCVFLPVVFLIFIVFKVIIIVV